MFKDQSMKKIVLSFAYMATCFFLSSSVAPRHKLGKILVITCDGGHGHLSATQSLEEYLSGQYDMERALVFRDIFSSLDPLHTITKGKYSGIDAYNYLLKHRYSLLLNASYHFYSKYQRALKHDEAVAAAEDYLRKTKPDLLISVVMFFNGALLEAAQRLNIPFIVVPTDLDAQPFIAGIERPTYNRFRLALSFDLPEIYSTLNTARIPRKMIRLTGAPVRRSFIEKHDRNALKNELGIPADKPTALVMLGGLGVNNLTQFVQELKKLAFPAHLIVCIGKDESMRSKLAQVKIPTHITMTVVSFTERIADYMAVSDLCLIKSGTASVCEALYSNLPMILDGTHYKLIWEALNHDIVPNNHFGITLSLPKSLSPAVARMFNNATYYTRFKQGIAGLEKKHFGQEINALVRELI